MTVRAHIEREMFRLLTHYDIEATEREAILKTCYEYQHAVNELEMRVK
jgi:hypothetical protein